ncbi:MAG: class I SAM-dependent methyltransferase [Candidatus Omnitrophota bacterium]
MTYDKNGVKDFFQRRVSKFDSFYEENKPGIWKLLDCLFRSSMRKRFVRALKVVGCLGSPTVLDIGCGPGRYAAAIVKSCNAKVFGIDFSPAMLKEAKAAVRRCGREGRCRFLCADFLEYPFKEKFDATLAIGFFDYIKSPLAQLKKIRALTLQKAIMSFPSRWHLRNIIRKIRLSFLGCPVYFYDRRQIEALLKQAGFDKFRIENLDRDYFVVCEI